MILRIAATNTAACFRCTSNHRSSSSSSPFVRSMTMMTQYATTTYPTSMNAMDCKNNNSHYSCYCRHPQQKYRHQNFATSTSTNTNNKSFNHTSNTSNCKSINNKNNKQEPVAIIEEKGTDQEQEQEQEQKKDDQEIKIVDEEQEQELPITDFSDISRAMVAIRDGIRRTECIKSYFLSGIKFLY